MGTAVVSSRFSSMPTSTSPDQMASPWRSRISWVS